MNSKIEVRVGTIDDVVKIHSLIPELNKPIVDDYAKRLQGTNHLILIAYEEQTPLGFKVGYDRYKDSSFYSWLGGVIPEHREKGVAKKLALVQENWALAVGYKSIKMKTRNKYKPMLQFALSNGFNIVGFEEKDKLNNHVIFLEKKL
ncbi:GNAT family N-acetyltransferase [Candidatus Woesearchaeota archaeon]|nr:GNAT family N-acetyltransferase [Candidatus Woesearchaeota archaeon]